MRLFENIRCLLPFFAFLCFLPLTEGKHIVGGEITYECLGNGNYRFTMFVYRDCNCVQCADYDIPAYISIYNQGVLAVPVIEVDPQNIEPVTFPEDPCLDEPDVCVQKGAYVFTVNLPLSTSAYTIEYQRCCRNETITNIINPGDSGATYSIDLTPEAQLLCNDSPTFNNFPPIVICAGFPLIFDHSASDSDNDQLVYEFCAPMLGGGLDGLNGPGAELCTGVQPNPPCPPPFFPVTYVLPTYSSTYPLAGNPVVTIDANTGLITGTPATVGQFVVGVCVSEYRNGMLLSVVRRDFQFNVAPCQPTVGPDLVSDSTSVGPTFFYSICDTLQVTLPNQSYTLANITSFTWDFYFPGDTVTYNGVGNVADPNWNPTVTLPDYGQYLARLILNPGLGCNDTGYVVINAYPGVDGSFTYSYDTCVAGDVAFVNTSQALGQAPIISYEWNFDDGATSTEVNPSHLFAFAGDHDVILKVIDADGCEETQVSPIQWYPAPPIIIIAPSAYEGCVPQSVYFDNLSFPIDSTYDIDWTFGDGGTSDEISPTHVYEDPGLYDISVSITSPIGCSIDTVFEDLILMEPSPTALFLYEPNPISNFNPLVQFIDLSIEASAWFWRFDSIGVSYKQNPSYNYQDTGLHQVTLIVTHESGCKDTLIRLLDVIPNVTYFLPNAFTPNEDGNNEFFLAKGYFEGMKDFNMEIYNRWGEQVFKTDSPNEGWNGTVMNNGNACEGGVYVYLVNFVTPRNEIRKFQGFVTLVR